MIKILYELLKSHLQIYVTIAKSTGCVLLSQIYRSESILGPMEFKIKIGCMYRYMYFHCEFYRLSTLQLPVPGIERTVQSVVVRAVGPGQPPWIPSSSVAEDPDLQRPRPTGCSGIPLVQIMLSRCSLNFFDTCVNIFIYMMKLVLNSEFVPFFSLFCLCSELIDKVQNEMHDLDLFDAVSDMFQGQLVSQVICKKC